MHERGLQLHLIDDPLTGSVGVGALRQIRLSVRVMMAYQRSILPNLTGRNWIVGSAIVAPPSATEQSVSDCEGVCEDSVRWFNVRSALHLVSPSAPKSCMWGGKRLISLGFSRFAALAQLVRAPDCGSGGPWFDPRRRYQ